MFEWIASPAKNAGSTTKVRIALTAKEQQAIKTALTVKVSIVTGGPGTGKTTTVRTLIQLLKAKRHTFKLAAPTGGAAKRLSEATDESAQTLHRLIEFKPFEGNVLKRLIASKCVPVVALDVIFRQSEDSLIIENAHRINRGQMPLFFKTAKDFFLFAESEPEKAAPRVIELVETRIPYKFGMNAIEDVQVLSPMHCSVVGVGELDRTLQDALNPADQGKKEWRHGSRVFRVGESAANAEQLCQADL